MDANKILNSDILDIIFDGRNKQYGAYDLRKTYNSRLKRALILTASLAVLIFLTSFLSGMVKKGESEELDVLETQMAEVKQNDAPPPPPPPPPPVAPPPPEINQIKFTPPKIVKDEEVKPDEKIEEIKEDQAISTKTVESDNKEQIVQAPIEDKGTQIVEAPKGDDEDKVFTKVENEAEFPGGNAAWARYLQKSLDGFNPADNGAPPGKYQVIVRFIVSRDGSISDVQAETKHGFGMEDQAIKCIKRGPNWKPALQNGRNVNAYRRQPVTFIVEE
ncbi:MAG TPA: energy transducer TonB [Ferruginibacter sp.]|nr:energy transducer TonB [Ferruginibacter sp.]HMP21301.1 energy transducer TonB [Ferruginibacter sp.]